MNDVGPPTMMKWTPVLGMNKTVQLLSLHVQIISVANSRSKVQTYLPKLKVQLLTLLFVSYYSDR